MKIFMLLLLFCSSNLHAQDLPWFFKTVAFREWAVSKGVKSLTTVHVEEENFIYNDDELITYFKVECHMLKYVISETGYVLSRHLSERSIESREALIDSDDSLFLKNELYNLPQRNKELEASKKIRRNGCSSGFGRTSDIGWFTFAIDSNGVYFGDFRSDIKNAQLNSPYRTDYDLRQIVFYESNIPIEIRDYSFGGDRWDPHAYTTKFELESNTAAQEMSRAYWIGDYALTSDFYTDYRDTVIRYPTVKIFSAGELLEPKDSLQVQLMRKKGYFNYQECSFGMMDSSGNYSLRMKFNTWENWSADEQIDRNYYGLTRMGNMNFPFHGYQENYRLENISRNRLAHLIAIFGNDNYIKDKQLVHTYTRVDAINDRSRRPKQKRYYYYDQEKKFWRKVATEQIKNGIRSFQLRRTSNGDEFAKISRSTFHSNLGLFEISYTGVYSTPTDDQGNYTVELIPDKGQRSLKKREILLETNRSKLKDNYSGYTYELGY